jgi:hypothetical protein
VQVDLFGNYLFNQKNYFVWTQQKQKAVNILKSLEIGKQNPKNLK